MSGRVVRFVVNPTLDVNPGLDDNRDMTTSETTVNGKDYRISTIGSETIVQVWDGLGWTEIRGAEKKVVLANVR